MNFTLTPIERMILESLNECEKNNLELFKCTTIPPLVLTNCLKTLLSQDLIKYRNGKYLINENLSSHMISLLKDQLNNKIETLEIISNCLESNHQGSSFNLKKVSLDPDDLVVYKGLINQMDTFIKEVNIKNKRKTVNSADKKIIFWGEGNYGIVINTYIDV